MRDFEDELVFSCGYLAAFVRDMAHVPDRFSKEEFAEAARAIAGILMVASGADEPLIDVRDDEFSLECAQTLIPLMKRERLA